MRSTLAYCLLFTWIGVIISRTHGLKLAEYHSMKKAIFLVFVGAILAACSSLETEYEKLPIGASRLDVSRVMGAPPYNFSHENVDAWRYAVVAGFGYCDYREFYIYRDTLILKNEYRRASIAGCTAGLPDIEWEPVFAAVDDFNARYPPTFSGKDSTADPGRGVLVEQLKELNEMRESGALTDEEYQRAKEMILIKED